MGVAEPSRVSLPPVEGRISLPLERALVLRRSVRAFRRVPLALEDLAVLLWSGQGVTGRQGERTAPSAGALYPLELLVAAGAVDGLAPALYRYRPARHELTLAAPGDLRADLAAACVGQGWMAPAPAQIVVVSVEERTTGAYGHRGRRYVAMEAGHVAQNVHLACVALDLGTVVVGAFEDATVRALLALAPGERAVCLMPVGRPGA